MLMLMLLLLILYSWQILGPSYSCSSLTPACSNPSTQENSHHRPFYFLFNGPSFWNQEEDRGPNGCGG